jgi:hypothetical protein
MTLASSSAASATKRTCTGANQFSISDPTVNVASFPSGVRVFRWRLGRPRRPTLYLETIVSAIAGA